MTANRIPVIFDCDNTLGLPGRDIDDGLTLFYLLGQPQIELIGITLTHGNSHLADVIAATDAMLKATGLQDQVEVHSGEGAAHFLARTAHAKKGDLQVLATGAQSNLKAANDLNGRFYLDVARLIVMGGVTGDLRLNGVPVKELNFSSDAEAALDVLTSPAAITLLNAHTTAEALFGPLDIQRLTDSPLGLSKYLASHMHPWVHRIKEKFGIDGFCNWDMAAAIALTHPTLFVPQVVNISPTLASLSFGDVGLNRVGKLIQMPSGIRDLRRFNNLIFHGWAECQRHYNIG